MMTWIRSTRRVGRWAMALGAMGAAACASGPSPLQRDIMVADSAAMAQFATDTAGGKAPVTGVAAPPAAAPANAAASAVGATGGAPVTAQPPAMAAAPGGAAAAAGPRAARASYTPDLDGAEAVTLDTTSGVFYVAGTDDKGGYVARLDSTGAPMERRWLANGVKTVVLKDPRGMALVGDTLWVTDATALRGFRRSTGAKVATIPLAAQGAKLLSDVAVGPDGALYVTDAAVEFSARGVPRRVGTEHVFRIAPNRGVTVVLESARLGQPMGIAWDEPNRRFLLAGRATDTIFAWRPGTSADALQAVAAGANGAQWEGIVTLGNGSFLATSHGGGVYRFDGPSGVRIQGPAEAGDITFDARRRRLVVPVPSEGRVEFWVPGR